jgi:hypothetical protein
LFYGSRAIYQGVPIQDLFRDEEESERDGCGGKEVNEVPLCAAYVVEVEVDGVKEESAVVKRGLRRVEKVDGGLTRKRWEANNNERNSTVRMNFHYIQCSTDMYSLLPRGNSLFTALETG